jgi:hypothetical protein
MREFVTAVKQAHEDDDAEDGMEFTVDGVTCKCYRPQDGQLAILMAATGRHSSEQEQVAGFINFFCATLDDESSSYIVSRLLDRKDPYGLDEVQEVMEWMIEEWTGRPTKPSSGSTRSQRTGGRKSTQSTPALTS